MGNAEKVDERNGNEASGRTDCGDSLIDDELLDEEDRFDAAEETAVAGEDQRTS